ncbi:MULTISPECIES: hypothetical protein [unclassified Streptomyces]|uniref:hypothetical protein n=1 Tax=unclassified Streptomyces TaxID=2593676 RepID=UPI002365D1C7|nr:MULTISPECIES: hypothetical protein [unclassified Streptomyces]MDF3139831.1 hypothetical protein [Streptomyces sp. T21Q-yed]WDF41889.1 hypothetical protein PBV52_36365 [Streptomyces sp. T12]
MNEAAQTAKRTAPYAACFEQIAHRRGRKIATTAIARKLHVLHLVDTVFPAVREDRRRAPLGVPMWAGP